MEIEEVAEATYRIEVLIPGARYTFAVYLLVEKEAILIEPGPTAVVPYILDGMKRLGIGELSVIIPTHIHMDHGGGAGALAERFPRSKVVMHPRAIKHAIDPSRLIASTRMAYGDDFEDLYGPILPIAESQVAAAEDGHVVDVAGRQLRIIHAPGHAFHHNAIFDEKTGGLFCGEALGVPIPGGKPNVLPSISIGDLDVDRYLESIEKLSKLRPRILFYPHEGGMRMPADIIPRIAENTGILRDVIFQGLKQGRSKADIELRIRERLKIGTSKEKSTVVLEEIILGFETYFNKNKTGGNTS